MSRSPVLYLGLDEDQGSVAHDYTNFANDATLVGVTWETLQTGKHVLSLDGIDDYGIVQNSDTISFASNEPFTVGGWIKFNVLPSSVGKNQYFIFKDQEYILRANYADDKMCFWVWDGADWEPRACSIETVEVGRWYFMTGGYDGIDTLAFALDGKIISTATNVKAGKSTYDLNIGRLGSVYSTVDIGMVCIIPKFIKESELTTIYEKTRDLFGV